MAIKEGIIGITETGKTIIAYNGVRFYTTDKSVIAMAARGGKSIASAAKRYIGKSSTARALRKANKEATKPIYENVAESLFKKVFKQKDKKRLYLDKRSLADFRSKYKKTLEETAKYIDEAITDKVGISDHIDKLPESLKSEVDSIITEEVEKAYSEKGIVENTDISRISGRIRDLVSDYKLNLIKQQKEIKPANESERKALLEEFNKQISILDKVMDSVNDTIAVGQLERV